MKLFKFCVLLLFLGGFFFCHKKDYPKPLEVVNPAVYYSKLIIDNTPVVLEAGVNGYYMYSSYKLDSSFVYNYVADLKQSDCSNCTNSIRIQINDYKVSFSGNTSAIDTSLRPDYYPFISGNPQTSYAVKFTSIPDNTLSYFWDFGDGTTSTLPDPEKTFDKEGIHNICLTTTSTNNYISTLCNKEKIDKSGSCKTRITANPSSDNNVDFGNITTGGKTPYKFLWNFGDGTTSQQPNPTCNYKYRGASTVSLRVVDALGDTAFAKYNVKTLTDNSSSQANYFVSTIQKVAPDPPLSQVTITWVDANGVAYTSNNALQPGNSSFEIISVSENEKNEKGQSTKKITARFNCKLYNGNKSITVNDADVVICVAYK